MWFQILACGLVVVGCFRHLLFDDNDVLTEKSLSHIIFHVAKRIEKIGGKVYVGLRIPDADCGSRQNIDMVFVNRGLAIVIAVRNFSGLVDVDSCGNWVCKDANRGRVVKHPDPIVEAKRQVTILESYLEQRGLTLPEGYLISRVLLPSSTCRLADSISDNPEVITSDKWANLAPNPRSRFSNWIMDSFRGKSEMLDNLHQQLHFILKTAPMWDRLELKGDKIFLGEFSDFKGTRGDIDVLKNVRRSKVSQLTIQKSSILGPLGRSHVHVKYGPRDYRSEGPSSSEWKEVTVRSSTEVIFLPFDSKKRWKIKFSKIVSMSLST